MLLASLSSSLSKRTEQLIVLDANADEHGKSEEEDDQKDDHDPLFDDDVIRYSAVASGLASTAWMAAATADALTAAAIVVFECVSVHSGDSAGGTAVDPVHIPRAYLLCLGQVSTAIKKAMVTGIVQSSIG